MYRLTAWARSSAAREFVGVVAFIAVLGIGVGALWWLFAPTMPGRQVGGGVLPNENQPHEFIAADGQFAVWTAIFGLAISVWLRRWWSRGPELAVVALALGLIAASTVAALVGGVLGPDDPATAELGSNVEAQLRLQSAGWLLVGAIAGVGLWFGRDFAAAWRASGSGADDEADNDLADDADNPAVGTDVDGLGFNEPARTP